MNRIGKIAISLTLMGLLTVSLWLVSLAQSEPGTEAGQSHRLYLPLVSNMGDSAITGQEEAQVLVEAPVSSDEVVSDEVVSDEMSVEVASEEILVEDTVSAAAINPSIRLNGQMAQFFGIRTNDKHGWITERCNPASGYFVQGTSQPAEGECGKSDHYKAWIDGPMNPYKYGVHTYFQIAHSENYRIKVPNHNWGQPTLWTMEGDTMLSARRPQEQYYDNRHWLFAVRNVNGTLYGLTHHEWYAPDNLQYIAGIPFLKQEKQFHYWITTIGWAQSATGGATWQMKPYTAQSARLVVVPEPSLSANQQNVFGFAHPSNIVQSGSYYYFFASSVHYGHAGQFKSGVSLFRTTAINQPTGWQYWNGSGWTRIDHSTYQGNFGRQMPYVFWERTANDASTHTYALNIRYHTPSRKWVVLGSRWCDGECVKPPVFSWLSNLASPTNLPEPRAITNFSAPFVASQPYYSFFDVSGSADNNYQNIGNNPLLVMINPEQDRYYHQYLTLTGFQ